MGRFDGKHRRERDAGEFAFHIGALVASLPGAIFGMAWLFKDAAGDGPPTPAWLKIAIVGGFAAAGWVIARILIARSSIFAAWLYPSTRGLTRPEHSQIDTLIARGDHEGAREALQSAIEADPTDIDLRIRMARLLRDDLGEYESAVRVFRDAIREAADPAREATLLRELYELFDARLGRASRARRDLSGFVERYADRPESEWPRQALSRLSAAAEGSPS